MQKILDHLHEHAKVLYDIPRQPPPHGPLPHESTFFTSQNVRNAIDWLQFGKAQDHDGLVGEHFIYACDTLLPFLAYIFNRATCEGYHLPIFKIKDYTMPISYRTIIIGHYMPKLHMAQV